LYSEHNEIHVGSFCIYIHLLFSRLAPGHQLLNSELGVSSRSLWYQQTSVEEVRIFFS